MSTSGSLNRPLANTSFRTEASLSQPGTPALPCAETAHLANDCAMWTASERTTLTVIVLGVWAVTSDAIGWLSGWRRADPGRLCRLLVWLSKVMSPAAAR